MSTDLPPRAAEPADVDIGTELEAVSKAREFLPFKDYYQDLVQEIDPHDRAEYSSLRREQQRIRRTSRILAKSELQKAKSLRIRRLIIGFPLFAVALFLLGSVAVRRLVALPWVPDWSWLESGVSVAISVVAMIAVVLGFLFYLLIVVVADVDLARDELENPKPSEEEFEADRQKLLKEIYRRTINRVLGPKGLILPGEAPDLVEIQQKKIVASETINFVLDFVADHSTSSIGIAGPRGSGKSTLIRKVLDDPTTDSYELSVSAVYEPIDLLRRLAFKLAYRTYEDSSESDAQDAYRRARMQFSIMVMAGILLGNLGLILMIGEASPDFFPRPVSSSILGGGLLMILGIWLGLYGYGQSRRIQNQKRADEDRARRLVQDLQSEVSSERQGKASLSIGAMLGVEGSSSQRITRRALTQAALVDELRIILEERASGGDVDRQQSGSLDEEDSVRTKRVVVALDELDKLPSAESLVSVVNVVKDLFRIPGVHFIVSVSDEALRSFTLRGLAERDAFDSAFDVIVEMHRLTPSEGVQLLESRVTGLPPELSTFCSIWAGGLPRDIIRAARGCISVFRTSNAQLKWPEVAKEFLKTDVLTRMSAATRGDAQLGASLVRQIESGFNMEAMESWDEADEVSLIWLYACCCRKALELGERLGRDVAGSQDARRLSQAIAVLPDDRSVAVSVLRSSSLNSGP